MHAFAQTFESQVADLVNKERSSRGLNPLTYNTALAKMADDKAKDMYYNNYFSHTSPTYGSPFDMMKSYGIQYTAAGENIAKGQKTPQEVMNSWMNSEGHRANILSTSYNQIGVGYFNGIWVQEFIKSNVTSSPSPNSNSNSNSSSNHSSSKGSSQHYTVKSGDTLWSIAKSHWINLNQIRVLNPNLKNYNVLTVGQKVRIAANVHTVKSGETAWNIANKYGMKTIELQDLNPQDYDISTLYVGQKLYVR